MTTGRRLPGAPNTQAMNVYIKSFNRPFYLDRCICSIKFNLAGYRHIIVLDDGTESAYLDHIRRLHPDVEIRLSGADDGKLALLRHEKFKEIETHYPCATEFWTREIGRDKSDYCLVLEDDAWIVRRIELHSLIRNLTENQAVICKLWWGDPVHRVTKRYTCGMGPDIEYYEPACDNPGKAYSVWIVAFALFRRDYWLHCVSAARRLADERSQLAAACDFINSHPRVRFAKTRRRCVHQGWMVPARSTSEYYDKGLVQHLYMDALNTAWLGGRLDPSAGYPYDFPKSAVSALFRETLSKDAVRIWEEWLAKEVVYRYD